MRQRRDLTGQKFNMLTAIKQVSTVGRSHWLCICECGKESTVEATNLWKLKVVSCGCYRDNKAKNDSTIHGKAKKTINNIWCGIKQRTRNPNCNVYHHYGGRGIDMYDEWYDSFLKFYEYFGDPPFKGACLDRIDNEKGYFPGNVRWTTQKEQCNNKRNNRFVTAFGKTQTVAQWAKEIGVNAAVISKRLNKLKWTDEEAVSRIASPLARKQFHTNPNEGR